MHKKTVGIYDRWLHTLGGGEQVAFAYAEVLRDLGFEVTLLCHSEVHSKKAEEKMNSDLTGIAIKVVPPAPDFMLSHLSENFDYFICNSYLDYVPPTNQKSILSLFFPNQVSMSYYDHFYRQGVARNLRDITVYPVKYKQFLYDDYHHRTVRKWCSNNSKIVFLRSVSSFSITFYFEYLSAEILEDSHFFINTTEIKPTTMKTHSEKNLVKFSFNLKVEKNAVLGYKIPIELFANKMAVVSVTIHELRYAIFNICKKIIPQLEMRLTGGFSFSSYATISKYNSIFVISKFSQSWVKKYWNISSKLLYPPVSTHSFTSSSKKKNQIVHIGRFFTDGHNKKQLELAQEFIKMCENGLTKWELHFVGSIAEGKKNQEYFEKIKEIAKKYPIVFHINVPFTTLSKILSESKIYWHATGLDIDEQASPIKLEHFGITTVEAMASGCVPVVIDKGGQSEIATADSGFTWKSRAELQAKTLTLIQNKALLLKMSKAAVKRSHYFSKENFKNRLKKLISKEFS